MTPIVSIMLLLTLNVGLLWLLMAAPLGLRTISMTRRFRQPTAKIWSAVDPLGENRLWRSYLISSSAVPDQPTVIEQTYRHLDRRGQPIRRLLSLEREADDDGATHGFKSRVIDDSALDNRFWQNFREHRTIRTTTEGTTLRVEMTDHYRGLAFLLFRYFALKRELNALGHWLETGKEVQFGIFERPSTQCAMALLSTFLLWPFFGLTVFGLMLSTFLTLVIVLHELGHMAAYRTFGHKSVRMIFVPFLGGIAIGGRPYNSVFEIATCALMGAGMSAFIVPILIGLQESSFYGILPHSVKAPLSIFILILGAFNLLNLLPMYRFDGGQVLRQICQTRMSLTASTLGITVAILLIGWSIGIPLMALVAALSVFTLISLIGTTSVRPKEPLVAMNGGERMMIVFGLYATIAIHGYAIHHAVHYLF